MSEDLQGTLPSSLGEHGRVDEHLWSTSTSRGTIPMDDHPDSETKVAEYWATLPPHVAIQKARHLLALALRKRVLSLPQSDRRVALVRNGLDRVLAGDATPAGPDPMITQAAQIIETLS